MSSIVNKIKEAVHQPHHSDPEGTHGTHQSRAANAADPRIDSDRDHRAQHVGGTAGTTGTTGMTGAHNTHTAGPHKSDAMNKADPRVDSDRDGSRNMGMNNSQAGYTTGAAGHTTGMPGHTTAGHITGMTGSAPEGTYGTHNSRVANAADPRIDSDRDGSRNMGANQPIHSTGFAGSHNTAATGTGPHKSNVLNKADPRVDSDRDGSRNMGMNDTTHQTTHTGYPRSGATHTEGNYGPHHTRAANAADPRINSDRDGSSTLGGTHQNGPAPHTAGPHNNDMMNKLDPRVDSNLDGSKTFGTDKTYAQSNSNATTGIGSRNPADASQVPPSVMRRHIGDVEIAHDDHEHDRERRNSVATHQEKHLMGDI